MWYVVRSESNASCLLPWKLQQIKKSTITPFDRVNSQLQNAIFQQSPSLAVPFLQQEPACHAFKTRTNRSDPLLRIYDTVTARKILPRQSSFHQPNRSQKVLNLNNTVNAVELSSTEVHSFQTGMKPGKRRIVLFSGLLLKVWAFS